MPTYEYQCQDCNHKVEYFQSMKEPPRTVCPRCGGRLVRLVSSGAGLIFKGTGFYVTDYKRKETGDSRHISGHRVPLEHAEQSREDKTGDGKTGEQKTATADRAKAG